jgi:hypothetical protein
MLNSLTDFAERKFVEEVDAALLQPETSHKMPQLQELPLQFYESISDLCQVRNTVPSSEQIHPSERLHFLTNLLTDLNIPFIVDVFQDEPHYPLDFQSRPQSTRHDRSLPDYVDPMYRPSWSRPPSNLYNIILPGTSKQMVLAHHDVLNLKSDNANDNSASVINAIAAKRLRPDLTVVLDDGEEPPFMGGGARRLARQIHAGLFGSIDSVINLELTGVGGPHFVIGDTKGHCSDHVELLFQCPRISTPPCDTTILKSLGVDSVVLVTLPPVSSHEPAGRRELTLKDGRRLDYQIIYRCHRLEDSIQHVNPAEMKAFVEQVLVPLCDSFRADL